MLALWGVVGATIVMSVVLLRARAAERTETPVH
jgi:hypothetical protein